MKRKILAAAVLAATASAAHAVPVTLTGDFVRAVVTDRGVMSSLQYDPTGLESFPGTRDYITPGTPFEGFGIEGSTAAAGAFSYFNSNSGGQQIAGSTAVAAGDNAALWTGGNSLFNLVHLFSFDEAHERVNITTTLTANTNLTNVRISRAVDPDPDVNLHGSFVTNNQRGIAASSIPVTDFVGSLGAVSGAPLGLYYSGPITHNTGIVSFCCGVTDPDTYLAGGEYASNSTGDHGIGIGFSLGDILSGASISWTYAYVMGGSLETIDIPEEPVGLPEPGTLMLLGGGLLALGLGRRRKQV